MYCDTIRLKNDEHSMEYFVMQANKHTFNLP